MTSGNNDTEDSRVRISCVVREEFSVQNTMNPIVSDVSQAIMLSNSCGSTGCLIRDITFL